MAGHLKKSGTDRMPLFISEVPSEDDVLNAGSKITASDVFFMGDLLNVAGVTRGKGFTGVVKRWGFHGGPKTHGQSDRHRAPGSIGQGTTPGRVYKGKKMAGRSGTAVKTIRNLKVVKVLADQNEIWVTGAVPGARGAYIEATVIKPMPRDKQEEVKQ
ncbi:MAG: 50S ribosomal protein L3, partial [Patescibacteria group bacterium]